MQTTLSLFGAVALFGIGYAAARWMPAADPTPSAAAPKNAAGTKRWARGEAAALLLAAAPSAGTDADTLRPALHQLIREEPEKALALLREDRRLWPLMDGKLFIGLAATDGPRAWKLFTDYRDLFEFRFIADMARAWAKKDGAAAVPFGLALPDVAERASFLRSALAAWSEHDFDAFFAWAQTRPDDLLPYLDQVSLSDQETTLDRLAELAQVFPYENLPDDDFREIIAKAAEKPEELARLPALIVRFADPKTRDKAWVAVTMGLADLGRLEEAQEAMRQIQDAKRLTEATSYLAATLAGDDPLEGLRYADALPTPRGRELARRSVLHTWSERDVSTATGYLKSNAAELTPDEAALIFKLWSAQNRVEAADWAAELPDKNAGTNLINRTAAEWARQDPDSAMQWLSAQPPSDQKERWIYSFAQGHTTSTNSPDYAMSLAFQQHRAPSEQKTNQVVTLVKRWLNFDEKAASGWLRGAQAQQLMGDEEWAQIRQSPTSNQRAILSQSSSPLGLMSQSVNFGQGQLEVYY